jgi:hypothetical protein
MKDPKVFFRFKHRKKEKKWNRHKKVRRYTHEGGSATEIQFWELFWDYILK